MKKLRRKGIRDVDAANAFLEAEYWGDHNRRFAQASASDEDFHVTVPRGQSLDKIFRLQETRTVSNDWVVRYENRLLQLERQSHRPPARSHVRVFEDVTGQLEIRYRDRVVRWTELVVPVASKPAAPPRSVPPPPAPARQRRPCDDHPWRRVAEQFQVQRRLDEDRKAYDAVNP